MGSESIDLLRAWLVSEQQRLNGEVALCSLADAYSRVICEIDRLSCVQDCGHCLYAVPLCAENSEDPVAYYCERPGKKGTGIYGERNRESIYLTHAADVGSFVCPYGRRKV